MQMSGSEAEASRREPVMIDGSMSAGGGQSVPTAVSLACILKMYIRVNNVGACKDSGLTPAQLDSILAIRSMRACGTCSSGRFDFDATALAAASDNGSSTTSDTSEVDQTIQIRKGGSLILCVQVLLPYLLTLPGSSRIRVNSGKKCSVHTISTNYDYLERVFIPMLTSVTGGSFNLSLLQPGYNRKGTYFLYTDGGSVQLQVDQPLRDGHGGCLQFKHFNLVSRGHLRHSSVILNLTPKLSSYRHLFVVAMASIPDHLRDCIEVRCASYASVDYFLQFEHTHVGFHFHTECKKPTVQDLIDGIELIEQQYNEFMSSEAVVDEFMQGQLIMYMALAKLSDAGQSSSMLITGVTHFAFSAIRVVQAMTGLVFHVQEQEQLQGTAQTFLISI